MPLLTVGVIVPLTGPVAEYGIAIRNGIEMAAEDSPQVSRQLRWRFEDSRYDSNAALASFRKLTATDAAQLLFVFGGPMSEVLAPLAERGGVPTLVTTTEPRVVSGKRFVVRFSNPADDYGAVLSGWLSSRHANRLGIVRTENQYMDSMVEGLRRQLRPGQHLEIVASFPPDERDFKSSVIRVARRYDALGIYLLPGQASSFFRLFRQRDTKTPAFGTEVFESKTEISQAGGAMDGAVFSNSAVSDKFHNRYLKRYGNDSQVTFAGYGHDLATLLTSLMTNQPRPHTPDELVGALKSSPPQDGVLGRFRFKSTPGGDAYFDFPVVLQRIEGDDIVRAD